MKNKNFKPVAQTIANVISMIQHYTIILKISHSYRIHIPTLNAIASLYVYDVVYKHIFRLLLVCKQYQNVGYDARISDLPLAPILFTQ